jgi:hypothetical protein
MGGRCQMAHDCTAHPQVPNLNIAYRSVFHYWNGTPLAAVRRGAHYIYIYYIRCCRESTGRLPSTLYELIQCMSQTVDGTRRRLAAAVHPPHSLAACAVASAGWGTCAICGVMSPSSIALSTQSRIVCSTGRSVAPRSDFAFLLSLTVTVGGTPLAGVAGAPTTKLGKNDEMMSAISVPNCSAPVAFAFPVRRTVLFFECFPYVCPEPVLAK